MKGCFNEINRSISRESPPNESGIAAINVMELRGYDLEDQCV